MTFCSNVGMYTYRQIMRKNNGLLHYLQVDVYVDICHTVGSLKDSSPVTLE